MLTIGGDDRVVWFEGLQSANRYCFLADVQMEKPANLGRAIEFRALFFEATDPQHLA
jgi:hypothetical protein